MSDSKDPVRFRVPKTQDRRFWPFAEKAQLTAPDGTKSVGIFAAIEGWLSKRPEDKGRQIKIDEAD